MKNIFSRTILALGLLLGAASARADVMLDLGVNGGFTENLLNDSTDVDDSFSSYNGSLRYYPVHLVELALTGDYTYYGDYWELSNVSGGFGVTVIPTKEESSFSFYISANFDGRRYREGFEDYDNNTFVATASAGYRLSPAIRTRLGLSFNSNHYLYSDNGDKETVELFTGVNLSFLGRNSFDLELGYGVADYKFLPEDLFFVEPSDPEASLDDGTLRSLYVSPRFSRPLGAKMGLNVTFMHRTFMNTEEGLVFSSAVGLLSPWTSVWEGQSITVNLKSYLIPHMITSVGLGFWDKTFLRILPGDMFPLVKGFGTDHEDEQKKVYLQVQRPIPTRLGMIQPNIRIDYADNSSSTELYDYFGFSLSAGITYQL